MAPRLPHANVTRATLIRGATTFKNKLEADRKSRGVQYKKDIVDARKELASKLRSEATRITKPGTRLEPTYRGELTITVRVQFKSFSDEQYKESVERVEKDIRLLKASSQAEFQVSTDSPWAKYL